MLKEEDFEIGIKLVIVGNGGVGKSSLIQRYCKGVFTKGMNDDKKTAYFPPRYFHFWFLRL